MAEGQALKRRGILAAAGAVVAGIAATWTSQPVAASSGGGDQGYLALGSNPWYLAGNPINTNNQAAVSSEPTVIQASPNFNNYAGSNGGHRVLLEIDASTNTSQANGNHGIVGIHAVGYGLGDGVDGHSTSGYGVYGESVSGSGVYGTSTNSAGVYGSARYGVYGITTGSGSPSTGVWGTTGGSEANTIGTYGTNASTGNGGIGVGGYIYDFAGANTIGVFGNNLSAGANGIGVYGSCANGTGIYGQTAASYQYGILGATYATNSTAIAGACSGNGSSAFSGGTTNPNAYAGVFQGNVVIQGRLIVSDPSYKSGALQHPDGSTRLVYCVESPESWIEDVGMGTLTGGKATVTFDKDFAAVTHTDTYHVFLTEYAETQGLFVSNRGVSGFTVQERNKGTTSGTFSWKVMVKAKSTVKSERLGKFTMPKIALPDVSKFKAPETPVVPPRKS